MFVLPRDLSEGARRNAATKPWRPRNAVWELTLACNLRCVHCGSRAGCARGDELSTAECLDVVAQLADLGGELLTLSGGEPLLRDDWDAIARAGVDRGLAVNLVTNGTLVDDRAARRAVAAGLCNVGVSLDGPEEVHDAIRGRGAFRRTVAGIARLRDAGMAVGILTTVHRLTLPWLDATRRLALDLGASQLRLQLGKPMGSLADRDDLVLSPRQIPGLVDHIVRMKTAGGIAVLVGDSIGYCGPGDRALRGWGWRGRPESWHGCQAGLQAVGIESDGGIKGCLSLQARDGDRDPFREGGLRDAPMAEWWFRPGAFAFNRDFQVDQLTGACRHCRHAAKCRGGAKCVAAAFTGMLTEDPYCDHRVRSLDARPGLRDRLALGAAAAAATMVLGLPGCDEKGGPDQAPDAVTDVAPADVPGADPGAADMGPTDVGATDPGAPDVPQPQDPATPDALPADAGADAIDCTNVCCLCDYGIIPDEVWKACCEAPTDVPPTDPSTADVPPPQDPGPAPDAVDCASQPCQSDPASIPPATFQECCTVPCTPPPCCECDYGLPPPPQCCR